MSMLDEDVAPEAADFDPEARRLCPDGGCTGLIGDDGRCKECGRSGGGAGDDAPIGARAVDDDGEDAGESGIAVEGDLDERRLCPDGSCIGLIGDDGRCKVCGATAT